MASAKKIKALKPFDKYDLYTNSVQGAEHDAELLWRMFRKNWTGPMPKNPHLQEDFCGTAALCYEWVKLSSRHMATGIDLDANALAWGATHHGQGLTTSQCDRVAIIHGDVLNDHQNKPHLISAMNFSYFFMHERQQLKAYFISCFKSLAKGGVLALDVFGGPDYLMPHSDQRRNRAKKFDYWWEIESFDAISHSIRCHIHFRRDGEARRQRVFSYDWRLWSIPELSDILKESGFKTIKYWAEGLDANGHGNGIFRPIKKETECETWITYIVAT